MLVLGAAIVVTAVNVYFWWNKLEEIEARKEAEERLNQKRGPSNSQMNGSWELVDVNNKPVRKEDLKGKFLLMYFGFTHCPDICPTELTKMGNVLELIEGKNKKLADLIQPIFITIDPRRDTPEKMKEYIQEFHPNLLAFSGSSEQIDHICKNYRVYKMKATADQLSDDDYLVDHSIVLYLVDPKGDFLSFFHTNLEASRLAQRMLEEIGDYYTINPSEKAKLLSS